MDFLRSTWQLWFRRTRYSRQDARQGCQDPRKSNTSFLHVSLRVVACGRSWISNLPIGIWSFILHDHLVPLFQADAENLAHGQPVDLRVSTNVDSACLKRSLSQFETITALRCIHRRLSFLLSPRHEVQYIPHSLMHLASSIVPYTTGSEISLNICNWGRC